MAQSMDRFRAAAAECVEAAAKSTDPDAAATLMAMAQKWLDLAHMFQPNDFVELRADVFNQQMGLAERKIG